MDCISNNVDNTRNCCIGAKKHFRVKIDIKKKKIFGQPCLKRRGIQMETFQMKDLIINLIIRSLAVAFFKKLEWRMEDVSN